MRAALLSKDRSGMHGIPRYAQELTEQMDSAHLFRYNSSQNNQSENITDWKKPDIPVGAAIGKALFTPLQLRSVKADVFHAIDPTETPPLWVGRRKPIVATIHDLIVFKNPMDFKWSSLYLSRLYLWFVKHFADEVIAISQSTKEDAVDILDIPPERITIINHGVDDRFRPLSNDEINNDIQQPAILMVGVAQPRKNIIGVVQAVSQLHNADIPAHLYLAGSETDHLKEVQKIAQSLSVGDYLHILGRVSDNRLVELYNLADVLAMPSFYEGFGFPVLEAMACGTPVVTSQSSSLPDVGGDVPLYVDPDDIDSIASSLEKVLLDDDLVDILSKQGIRRAEKFDWAKTADQTYAVYEKAVEGWES